MTIKEDYYVVDFHHIDDPRCFRPLSEAVCDPHFNEPESADSHQREIALRTELASLFIDAGWEGDGEINCIFVPPCLFDGKDGWCGIVYHVKQINNGTSWLAIPKNMKPSLPDGMIVEKPCK